MPYKNEETNRRADAPHANDIPALHALPSTQYDSPRSVKRCACVACNRARREHGVRERTWQGLARTKH